MPHQASTKQHDHHMKTIAHNTYTRPIASAHRNIALAALATVSPAMTAIASEPDSQQRPNIVLFMVDDMGWQDTSVPFTKEPTDNNRKYLTPNMERLAAAGMKFTQAYACAISSPSRCSSSPA